MTKLTHWGRVTHICVSTIFIIGSSNRLSVARRQLTANGLYAPQRNLNQSAIYISSTWVSKHNLQTIARRKSLNYNHKCVSYPHRHMKTKQCYSVLCLGNGCMPFYIAYPAISTFFHNKITHLNDVDLIPTKASIRIGPTMRPLTVGGSFFSHDWYYLSVGDIWPSETHYNNNRWGIHIRWFQQSTLNTSVKWSPFSWCRHQMETFSA